MKNKREYPRPQFCRSQWQSLNGAWKFAFDDEDRGMSERWYETEKGKYPMEIQVPFVYQSGLSGIGDATPHDIVWYKRRFRPEGWEPGRRAILHFGAVDYETAVFVNGRLVKEHEGGNTPFSVDITPFLSADGAEQTLAVRVFDPHGSEEIPRGKQYWKDRPESIWYTNSTGIWQTVWLECLEEKHLECVRFTPCFDEGRVRIECRAAGVSEKDRLEYGISYKGQEIASGFLRWHANPLKWEVDLVQNHIFRTGFHHDEGVWTPEHPNLFDVRLTLRDEQGEAYDLVDSYFGFRKIHTDRGIVYLNNRPYYQKLVLDQGYWPEGLLTAPDDEALKRDILLAKDMGFNGCRKHQKTEDPRFLYWADHLGYLVWGECASAPVYTERAAERTMREWMEIVSRDYNHPCIITGVPLNESWGVPHIRHNRTQQHFSQALYHMIHALDSTRLVISNDGWEMTETDICAIHNYAHGEKEETGKYAAYREMLSDTEKLAGSRAAGRDLFAGTFSYQGQPILLTEFGGIGFDVSGEKGWGYTSVQNEEEFVEDYKRIMKAVYASAALRGFCYTQLTDVEQEINGLYTYDRKPKADPKRIREINEHFFDLK